MAYNIFMLVITLAIHALAEFLVFKYLVRNRKGLVFVLKDKLVNYLKALIIKPAAE